MANSRISRNRPMNPGRRAFQRSFWMMVAFMVIGLLGMSGCSATGPTAHDWRPFGFMSDPDYNFFERFALIANVLIALAAFIMRITSSRKCTVRKSAHRECKKSREPFAKAPWPISNANLPPCRS